MTRRANVVVNTTLKAKDLTSRRLIAVARAAKLAKRGLGGASIAAAKLGVNAAKMGVASAGALITLGTLANKRTREMETLAASVGQNVTTMEALGVAARGIGLNYENVIDLAEEMNNKLGEFEGLGDMTSAREALEIMGLQYSDIKKLKPEEQFEKITAALLEMPDPQNASSAADMLFGGEASKFFGHVSRLGLSLDQIKRQYRDNNLLTDDGRKGAIAWTQAMGRLRTQAGTLGAQLSGVAGGALAPFVTQLTNWVSQNKELIQGKIDEFVKRLVEYLKSIDWASVAESAKQFSANLASVDWKGIANGAKIAFENIDKVAAALGGVIAVLTGGAMAKALLNMKTLMGGGKTPNNGVKGGRGSIVRPFVGAGILAALAGGGGTRIDENSSVRTSRGLYDWWMDRINGPVAAQKLGREYAEQNPGAFNPDTYIEQFARAGANNQANETLLNRVGQLIERLEGSLDINVNLRGQPVESVGVVKSSGLVGNVGTTLPTGYYGDGR